MNPQPAPLPVLWLSPEPPSPLPPAEPEPSEDAPRAPAIPPQRLWEALAHPLRWRLLLRLAAGEELTAPIAMRGSGLRLTTVREHLRILRSAGVIASRPGLDRRSEVFYLPAARRPAPGVLDFGFCRLHLTPPPAKANPAPPPPIAE